MGQARTGGVRVFADQSQPEGYDEDGQGGDREPVLGVDGGEEQRRRDQSDAGLQGSTEEDLFADAGDQRQGGDADWVVELAEDMVRDGLDSPRQVRRQGLARVVHTLAESEKEAGGGECEGQMPPGGADQAEPRRSL